MSAPAKTSAIQVPAAKTSAKTVPAPTPSKGVPTQAGLKPDSDQLDLKIPDEIGLATPLGPALELIPPDPDAKQVTKGGRGPITKKRKRPAASGNSGSGSSGRAAAPGRRREKAPPVLLIIGIPVLLLGVGVVFLLGGGKPAPTPSAPEPPAPKREPAAVFVPKGLNEALSAPAPAPAAASTPAPGDAPTPPPAKPGSGKTPEEREAARLEAEEIAAQKKLIEERTKRLGGEPTGAAPAPASE